MVAEVVRDVIIQAAATSFVYMQTLATSQVVQSALNVGIFRGVSHPGILDGFNAEELMPSLLLMT